MVIEPVALVAAYHAAGARLALDKRGPLLPHEAWGYHFELDALVREIFGNPFRPVVCLPGWRTDTALSLARQMYESRDFSPMPILADALQDAGCDNTVVLDHCRSADSHVRGCWVVDSVLGKE